jgi:hypothetical protein
VAFGRGRTELEKVEVQFTGVEKEIQDFFHALRKFLLKQKKTKDRMPALYD